jgi:hypothetical protein
VNKGTKIKKGSHLKNPKEIAESKKRRGVFKNLK